MKKILLVLTMVMFISLQADASTCDCVKKAEKENNCTTIKEFLGKCDYQIEQKKILEELKLNDEQNEQVKLLFKQKNEKTKPLEKELKKAEKTKEKLILSKASTDKIAAQEEKISKINNEITQANKTFTKNFHKVLTSNQKIKLYEIKIKKVMDGSLDIFLDECGCSVDCNCKEGCECGCKDKNETTTPTIDLNNLFNTIFTPQQKQQIQDQSKQIQQQIKTQSVQLQQQIQQQMNTQTTDFHKEVQKHLDNVQKTLDSTEK